jgi:two-component system LytT family response regulator
VYFLKPLDIHWIEADGDYVSIHTETKTHLVRETLKTMEERLGNEGFQRIHRSSLVNLEAIRELIANDNGDYQVVLKDDTVLKLSRNYRDQLYSRLNVD